MRIVIVEDETLIRKDIINIINNFDEDYEVVGQAENGKKGLEIIRRENPDVVILDIHMPNMDGLTMLEKIREEGFDCKVIILTVHSNFEYAKRAIDLGIEGYLLKPIVVDELKRVLKQSEKRIVKQSVGKHFMDLDKIFLNAITGQWEEDINLAKIIENEYGIAPNESIVILGVNLGESYARYHDSVKIIIQKAEVNTTDFKSYVMEFPKKKSVVVILYQITSLKELHRFFQHRVLPMLCAEIPGEVICTWGLCKGLLNVRNSIVLMDRITEWNLFFGKGVLISEDKISKTTLYALKYPIQIEAQFKTAFLGNDAEEYRECIHKLREYCRKEACSPYDMKEAAIRCLLAVRTIAKESGRLPVNVSVKNNLEELSQAVSWKQIESVFLKMFELREQEPTETLHISALVQKALQYIHEYYNQGIKLEEISHNLNVSEEYLSTQFRKETGKTFSAILREYKVEKVKELLSSTALKMREIADLTGYSDAKYMSRVFKEEVGMLPSEYRKKNCYESTEDR